METVRSGTRKGTRLGFLDCMAPSSVRGALAVPRNIAIAISLANGRITKRGTRGGVVGRNGLALVSDNANNALGVPVRGCKALGTGNNAMANRIAGGNAVAAAKRGTARFSKNIAGRDSNGVRGNAFSNRIAGGNTVGSNAFSNGIAGGKAVNGNGFVNTIAGRRANIVSNNGFSRDGLAGGNNALPPGPNSGGPSSAGGSGSGGRSARPITPIIGQCSLAIGGTRIAIGSTSNGTIRFAGTRSNALATGIPRGTRIAIGCATPASTVIFSL